MALTYGRGVEMVVDTTGDPTGEVAPHSHSYDSIQIALRVIASGRYPVSDARAHNGDLDQTHEAILAIAASPRTQV